jgi:hypothetical protein
MPPCTRRRASGAIRRRRLAHQRYCRRTRPAISGRLASHGAAPGYWSPLQEGANFEFSFITKPLEPYRKYVTLISGMDMPEAMATTQEPGGDHARGAVLLSRARPRRKAVSRYRGVTLDQLIAKKYGRDMILESIQLGVEQDGNFGNCNWGYSCAYTNSISWRSPGGSVSGTISGNTVTLNLLVGPPQPLAIVAGTIGPNRQFYSRSVQSLPRYLRWRLRRIQCEQEQLTPRIGLRFPGTLPMVFTGVRLGYALSTLSLT